MPNNEHQLRYLKMCKVVLGFFEKEVKCETKMHSFQNVLRVTEFSDHGHEVVHLLNQPSEHGEPGKEWMHREPIWKRWV